MRMSLGKTHLYTECYTLGIQISLLHYGAMNESADADWFAAFSALPHTWYAQGITEGGCYIAEHDSFYDYEMTVPNVTVTNVVRFKAISENYLPSGQPNL